MGGSAEVRDRDVPHAARPADRRGSRYRRRGLSQEERGTDQADARRGGHRSSSSATHSPRSWRAAPRAIWLDGGKILADGDAREVAELYQQSHDKTALSDARRGGHGRPRPARRTDPASRDRCAGRGRPPGDLRRPVVRDGRRPPQDVTPVDVPRAVGRRRLKALLAARKALRRLAPSADVILVHDPELLLALPRARAGLTQGLGRPRGHRRRARREALAAGRPAATGTLAGVLPRAVRRAPGAADPRRGVVRRTLSSRSSRWCATCRSCR